MINIYIFLLHLISQPIIAAEPTSLPTPTNTISVDIQKIREAVQQKVKEKLKEIVSPDTGKRGITGKITSVEGDILSLEYKNEIRQITLDPEVSIIDIKRNKSSVSKLITGQEILVLGYQEVDSFVGKRIVFINSEDIVINKTVISGKIVDISRTTSVMTLVPLHNKNILFQVKIDTKTEFYTSQNKKISKADINSGDRVIAILRPDEKTTKTYNALRLVNLDYSPSPTPTKK